MPCVLWYSNLCQSFHALYQSNFVFMVADKFISYLILSYLKEIPWPLSFQHHHRTFKPLEFRLCYPCLTKTKSQCHFRHPSLERYSLRLMPLRYTPHICNNTVNPTLTEHCCQGPPVLKGYRYCWQKDLHITLIDPATKDHLSLETILCQWGGRFCCKTIDNAKQI